MYEIQRKNNVPEKLNGTVGAFCREISNMKPVYIEYVDAGYKYEATHCHDNVCHYVKNHGGSTVSGWIIWKDTDFKLEAEHHSVWLSPSGKLYDITPRVDGEELIVFLQDGARPYNLSGNELWCNRIYGVEGINFIANKSIQKTEKIPYYNYHPYHDWIKNLQKNEKNILEQRLL
jgi:hypothetical protein